MEGFRVGEILVRGAAEGDNGNVDGAFDTRSGGADRKGGTEATEHDASGGGNFSGRGQDGRGDGGRGVKDEGTDIERPIGEAGVGREGTGALFGAGRERQRWPIERVIYAGIEWAERSVTMGGGQDEPRVDQDATTTVDDLCKGNAAANGGTFGKMYLRLAAHDLDDDLGALEGGGNTRLAVETGLVHVAGDLGSEGSDLLAEGVEFGVEETHLSRRGAVILRTEVAAHS